MTVVGADLERLWRVATAYLPDAARQFDNARAFAEDAGHAGDAFGRAPDFGGEGVGRAWFALHALARQYLADTSTFLVDSAMSLRYAVYEFAQADSAALAYLQGKIPGFTVPPRIG